MKKWLLFFLFVLSCSDGPETIVFPPGSVQPVVTRVILTDSEGREFGIWGNPNYSMSFTDNAIKIESIDSNIVLIPRTTRVENPYPNPAIGSMRLTFSVSKTSKVSIFAVKARARKDIPDEVIQLIGTASHITLTPTINIWVKEVTAPGNYSIPFDIPESGFFRIYFQIGDSLFWKDILNLPDMDAWNEFFNIN